MCDTLEAVGAEVSEADKLCVQVMPYNIAIISPCLFAQVAGLCHDLGHGPYSHLWEGFIRAVNGGKLEWEHERSSIDFLDLIIESKSHN